jgi:hypothetical protein
MSDIVRAVLLCIVALLGVTLLFLWIVFTCWLISLFFPSPPTKMWSVENGKEVHYE